jgi:hypothetical protein
MGKQKLKDLVKQLNKDFAPPDGWRPEDQVPAASAQDKPEGGKVYALTGGVGSRCIANGNTWRDSEVAQDLAAGADAVKES